MVRRLMRLSGALIIVQAASAATPALADSGPTAAQHPLMVIEQHRASVVQRIVSDWTDTLPTPSTSAACGMVKPSRAADVPEVRINH
jgi:hypothetical protein